MIGRYENKAGHCDTVELQAPLRMEVAEFRVGNAARLREACRKKWGPGELRPIGGHRWRWLLSTKDQGDESSDQGV